MELTTTLTAATGAQDYANKLQLCKGAATLQCERMRKYMSASNRTMIEVTDSKLVPILPRTKESGKTLANAN